MDLAQTDLVENGNWSWCMVGSAHGGVEVAGVDLGIKKEERLTKMLEVL